MITPINYISSGKNFYLAVDNGSVNNSVYAPSKKNDNELEKMANLNRMQISFSGIKKIEKDYPKHKLENYSGCMLGGAIGDAIGNPVEYDSLDMIRERYGNKGVSDLLLIKGIAQITEDTQLSIFTADGIIKSSIRQGDNKLPNMRDMYDSYQDWMKTQKGRFEPTNKGWISNIQDLHHRRAHGLLFVPFLQSGMPGSIEFPINYLANSDGLLRTAPVGLRYYKNPELAFESGARCASLTHGSPSGYLPAGFLSCLIANIVQGKDMKTAVDDSLVVLKKYKDGKDLIKLIEKSKNLADSRVVERTAIKRIGEGWNADEAIAIGVYCALKSPNNYENAVLTSINHSGDSNTIGAITGNIVGAYLGANKIPEKWKEHVELSKELSQISKDLITPPEKIINAEQRYPLTEFKTTFDKIKKR